jgi:hypothetical protein
MSLATCENHQLVCMTQELLMVTGPINVVGCRVYSLIEVSSCFSVHAAWMRRSCTVLPLPLSWHNTSDMLPTFHIIPDLGEPTGTTETVHYRSQKMCQTRCHASVSKCDDTSSRISCTTCNPTTHLGQKSSTVGESGEKRGHLKEVGMQQGTSSITMRRHVANKRLSVGCLSTI